MSKKISNDIIINWKPNRDSDESVVDQIVNYMVKQISRGEWLINQKLPSQRKLAELFEVNRSTIVDVFSELSAQGIIESNFGKGTIIINNTWSLFFSNIAPEWNKYIGSGIHKANLPTIQIINTLEFKDDIIRLSTGEMSPELFPHEMMKTVLNRIPSRALSLNYIEPLGLKELRIAISNHLKVHGLDIPHEQILIVSGSLQALQLISLSLLKKGSTVYVEEPSYAKSLKVFESSGMNMNGVPMDREGICPWMLNWKISDKNNSILYTIPTFHNPTSKVMSLKRRDEVLKWCKSRQLPIIEDDVYRELWFDKEPPPPLKLYDNTGNILYLGSVSKSLAPGLRIGWVAGPQPVVNRLGDIKMQTDYGASSLSQWALTEWIESGLYAEHLITFRRKLLERRNFVLDLLNRYYSHLATWDIPMGGYYIWITLKTKINTAKLFDVAIKNRLLINPGSLYSFKDNVSIRLSYSYTNLADLERGLLRLSELIRALVPK